MSVREYNKREESINQCRKYSKTMLTMRDLGIKEVSSNCQMKNGTQVFRLPFKDAWGWSIEFATYSSGYVRRLVTYHTRGAKCWQINKRIDGEETYYKVGDNLYRKFTSRTCKLIPLHGDRIEYLLKFILRNYFVAKPKYNHTINMEMLDRAAKYTHGEFGFDSCDSDTQDDILKRLQG
tara:strand:- start:64 stop:600 length:537 start_codon:yes stop_codon:yes gene_type:complete